jgi:hypothetical protein
MTDDRIAAFKPGQRVRLWLDVEVGRRDRVCRVVTVGPELISVRLDGRRLVAFYRSNPYKIVSSPMKSLFA